MRVIGIDPGSTVTGYGIVEYNGGVLRHIDNGGIRPKSGMILSDRLREIFSSLETLIKEHRPDAIVIENVFVAKNVKSALMLGHARGVALLAASNARVEIAEYTPMTVKKSVVGTGSATKDQVQQMVRAILKLPETAMEDASDALAAAICHCHSAATNSRISAALERGAASGGKYKRGRK